MANAAISLAALLQHSKLNIQHCKDHPQLVLYFRAPPLRAASMLRIPDPRVAM
jgi:hypothetical protein